MNMTAEENREYKRLKELAEKYNLYAELCPNRHLFTEGFMEGYKCALAKS
jgi:hypothetical protein